MVKLKKYVAPITHFVLFLTFLSCSQNLAVTRIEGKQITIIGQNGESAEIAEFITPYREHINKELNTVLAFAPKTLDKSGEWQSAIGNMFADAVLFKANPIFKSRENKSIDVVMLNHGGIRSIIPRGDVTTRTAFEIMPFENSAVVVAMRSEHLVEMAQYIITEKKPHPLTGMTFTIGKNGEPKNIQVGGQPLDKDRIYYVATNDYLYNGGDRMVFFKKGTRMYDLDYKLRNVLIDYFADVDTLDIVSDKRIIVE